MAKATQNSTSNVFKTIVREVVKDELQNTEKRLETQLESKLGQRMDNSLTRFKDEVLTGLDELMGEVKAMREEQTMHQGQHDDSTDRLEKLESIHSHN